AAIQRDGLRVISVHSDFAIRPATATDDPSQVGPFEYVIVAIKNYQMMAALPEIAKLVDSETTVVPLLNGVEAADTLAERIDRDRILGGFCVVFSEIEAPGVIRQKSEVQRVVIGELEGASSQRVERLVDAWNAAGVEAVAAEDILSPMWDKFVFIASLSGVTSLARATVGEMLAQEPSRDFYVQALEEAAGIGRARGVALADDVVERRLAFAEGLEHGATTSMQRDVASGHRFELEAFSGALMRMAHDAGIPAPAHEAIYALLLPALAKSNR
ncbi:MAG: 2-dehydropantoate 2-reductase, partial [Anaerolineales bacterium]